MQTTEKTTESLVSKHGWVLAFNLNKFLSATIEKHHKSINAEIKGAKDEGRWFCNYCRIYRFVDIMKVLESEAPHACELMWPNLATKIDTLYAQCHPHAPIKHNRHKIANVILQYELLMAQSDILEKAIEIAKEKEVA